MVKNINNKDQFIGAGKMMKITKNRNHKTKDHFRYIKKMVKKSNWETEDHFVSADKMIKIDP
ncbi:MAG: hypothetical protein WCV59_00915 [Parcubacteria group bacterium]|jgi:hypothetical protein